MDKFFEMNNVANIRKDSEYVTNGKLNPKSPIVEIFSDIAFGNDLTKHGKKVDKIVDRFKELGERAHNGDYSAKAEINTIVRYAIEPKLLQAVQLYNFIGTYKEIPYNEQPMVKTYKHESIRSQIQASQGDVSFATTVWHEYPVKTKTISSGYAVNYREIASGNLDKVSEGMDQVQTDMLNKANVYVIHQLYNGIKNATGVKYFAEAMGLTKGTVDDMIKKVRRFGRVSLAGDYSVVSQLNGFAGFQSTTPNIAAVPESAMDEVRKTGLLTTYNGSPVIELPNQYNLTQLNAAGDNFKTYLPEGLLFGIPQGAVSPLQIFKRGGLTSMSGNDVVTGTEITRFDMEFAAEVAKGREFEIGLVSDSNYEVPSI
ncbi:hypothetical protein [Paenibacillus elgii]|uniref:hypothetical protein n=1 Tax=Paenibacillus elgii TaxID=189691 RepID=UPI00203AFF32|nr:hypothetical protein [Paenibacillus elgii]MCM3273908.1 hypothetical protein [Paenibacillus elgii]